MKPVLLGMNNPHSIDPAKALATRPQNASGWRLWQMLSISGMCREPPMPISSGMYEDAFDRYNLLNEEVFDPSRFTNDRASEILGNLQGRIVVMCGTNVPTVFGLKFKRGFQLEPEQGPGFVYYIIPHPSGLCREYNEPDMRAKVGNLLLTLYILGGMQ